MTTLDVDSLRIELMRDIQDTEDIDVLKTVKRTLTRALAKVKERQVAAGRQRGRGGVYQQAGNSGRYPFGAERVLSGEEGRQEIT